MTKMKAILSTLASLALLLTLAGSATATDEPEPAELTGIDWNLATITADGTSTDVPDGVSATLHMRAGEASGSGGCNDFSGSYHVDGPILTFGPLAATKMFCEGPEQDVEDAYLAALSTVAWWAIADDGSLRLLDASESEVLAFSAAQGGIEGIDWRLRQQAVGDTLADIPDGIIVSLRMQDGEAGGSGGCNRYFTEYRLGDSAIVFGSIGSTLMACGEPAGTVESTYFDNLANVSAWLSEGDMLTFSDDDGNALLAYEAAPEGSVIGSWIALGINNGKAGVVSSRTTTDITAEFSAEGDLTGFDGCNSYFTTYEVDGSSISISDAIGSTRMACASEELAAQAQEYYVALGAATTWSVDDGGNLQLRDDGSSLQVDYMPATG